MNKIQYKNILVLDIDTKNIDKISRITEIARYHTKKFIYDKRDNKIKHYVRDSSKKFNKTFCSHNTKDIKKIKMLSKIINDDISDILSECDYIIVYNENIINILLDELYDMDFFDDYKDLKKFYDKNKILYIENIFDDLWSYKTNKKLSKDDNLNRLYKKIYTIDVDTASYDKKFSKVNKNSDLKLDSLEDYVNAYLKILNLTFHILNLEETTCIEMLNKKNSNIMNEYTLYQTSKIVKLAVTINKTDIVKLAINSHEISLIDPHVGFTYACSYQNFDLVEYYLKQKYAPNEKYLRYITVDMNFDTVYKLFKMFCAYYFRIDDNAYETILYIIHPLNKNNLTKHELNLDFISDECKQHFATPNIKKYMRFADTSEVIDKNNKLFENECKNISIKKFIKMAQKQKPTEKCFINITQYAPSRTFYYIHEAYGYIPSLKIIKGVKNECRKFMYSKFFEGKDYKKLISEKERE